jgi:hypothetical protein
MVARMADRSTNTIVVRRGIGAALSAIALAATAIAQQPPAGSAILAGQAVDAVTGAPVANTLIGLSQRTGSGPNTTPTAPNTQLVLVMADSQGRFVVRDVPKGSFLLLATAPGYIVSNHGQARAGGPTRTIDLTGGERLVDLKIQLWRHGVISGALTDEAGEPIVGATVRVLRRVANGPGGQRRYLQGTETTTDDRGQYRLTALSPGQFLVAVPQTQVTVPASIVDTYLQSVSERGGGAGGQLVDVMSTASAVPSVGGGVRIDDWLLQSSGNGRQLTMPPPTPVGVFVYPAVLRGLSTDASREIAVGPGEERKGVDISLRPVRAVRVSGRVTADGAPVGNVAIRLVAATGPILQNQMGFESATTVSGADGSFTLLGVTPGQYILKILRTARLTLPPGLASNPAVVAAYAPAAPAAPTPPTSMAGAQVPLTIGNADIQDLDVAIRPGATLKGAVVFGAKTPTPQQLQAMGLLLTSEDGGLPGAGLLLSRLGANGTFMITAPAPGRYLLTTVVPPAGWRSAGITIGGGPLASPLDLTGEDVADVTLTFTDELAELSGVARRANGGAVSTAGLVVFPVDRASWTTDPLNVRQPRIEQTAGGGVFRMPGLLPGEYFVAAIEDADIPELADPAFFEAVARFATRVTLAAGQSSTQNLVVRSVR